MLLVLLDVLLVVVPVVVLVVVVVVVGYHLVPMDWLVLAIEQVDFPFSGLRFALILGYLARSLLEI